ncbi:16S rRNA (uracil1498-N3)-methyltransferase [Propionivibrio dicarboxylicus]|uniref:Ribosomal RNA small subunit methyltransferase E n=2 Tax=Propionivibrio dicarboxylicus TaxID=83767 RepID=A0A1G8MH99_9RHOO|nr:16S rRNA (uracil1498-N3)-methyltransferase [Propionivibrio dicarboxylicus]
MRMNAPRFFCPLPLVEGAALDLPEDAARHAGRVLRLRAGDALTLFDGRGGEVDAVIDAVARDCVSVRLGARHAVERESPLAITLVQALQTGDKMDATVQKAVELGVSRIVPVVSRRSVLRLDGERARRRAAHWRGVAVAACEQCGRNRVPEIEEIVALDRWLAQPVSGVRRLMLVPEAEAVLLTLAPPTPGQAIELLIGAEGGLAPEETALATSAGFCGVRLGPRVLRTETAGMAALAAIQAVWGDFA